MENITDDLVRAIANHVAPPIPEREPAAAYVNPAELDHLQGGYPTQLHVGYTLEMQGMTEWERIVAGDGEPLPEETPEYGSHAYELHASGFVVYSAGDPYMFTYDERFTSNTASNDNKTGAKPMTKTQNKTVPAEAIKTVSGVLDGFDIPRQTRTGRLVTDVSVIADSGDTFDLTIWGHGSRDLAALLDMPMRIEYREGVSEYNANNVGTVRAMRVLAAR
jgi:hypothetical protein